MGHEFRIEVQPTPDSCGPACLSSIYRWFNRPLPLDTLIKEIPFLPEGGTFCVYLGIDAIQRGFAARLYSCNLHVLDPSWFPAQPSTLTAKLVASRRQRRGNKERQALEALETFLGLGGQILMEPLTRKLLRKHLRAGSPILTGLSSTFLYQQSRQDPRSGEDDDLAGVPEGHFVVCHGYDPATKNVTVYDPYPDAPFDDAHRYTVHIDRLINAILLGVLTYDATLLVISPRS
jgi:hypothetical protein